MGRCAFPRKRRRRGGQEHEVSGLYLSAAEGRISRTAALHESACRINGTKVVSTPVSRAPARGNAGSCGTGALAGVLCDRLKICRLEQPVALQPGLPAITGEAKAAGLECA